MGLGFWEAGLLLAIVIILFGAGKLPTVMGDLAKGIKRFKADMAEDAPPAAEPPPPSPPAPPSVLTHRPPSAEPTTTAAGQATGSTEPRPADRA